MCRDVLSVVERHLDITFELHEFDSSPLVSVLISKVFNHPYIYFFHSLENVFLLKYITSFLFQFRRDFYTLNKQVLVTKLYLSEAIQIKYMCQEQGHTDMNITNRRNYPLLQVHVLYHFRRIYPLLQVHVLYHFRHNYPDCRS